MSRHYNIVMPFLPRRVSSAALVLAWGTVPLWGSPRGLRGALPSTLARRGSTSLTALSGQSKGGELASPASRQGDAEQDLLARLQRERDPVRKAKYEIRLGRMKLLQAIQAYDQGNLDQCRELLSVYLERMKSSWGTLKSSGRQAVRHPQGFKELDIALREDERTIEDLKRRVPYLERTPIEKTGQEVEQLHGEVFRALFPAEQPREPGRRSPHQGRANALLRGLVA